MTMTNEKPKQRRVHWTPNELTQVAAYLVAKGADPLGHWFPGEARAAQEMVLPADRHKKLGHHDACNDLKAEMHRLRNLPKLPDEPRPYTGAVIEPARAESIVEKVLAAEPTPEPIPETVAPAPAVERRLGLDDLAQEMGERIADAVMEHLVVRLEIEIAAVTRSMADRLTGAPREKGVVHPPEVLAAKVRSPRVVVVGPWPALFGQLKSEFGEVFDMELVGPDESLQQLKDTAKRADYVLAMTSKISHKHTDTLKAIGANLYEVGGGLSGLRDCLTRIYVGIANEEKVA